MNNLKSLIMGIESKEELEEFRKGLDMEQFDELNKLFVGYWLDKQEKLLKPIEEITKEDCKILFPGMTRIDGGIGSAKTDMMGGMIDDLIGDILKKESV